MKWTKWVLMPVLLLAVAGCGKVAERAMESMAESVFEEISEMPADWPAQVPVHPAAQPRQEMRVPGSLSVTCEVDAPLHEVRDWYRQELADWTTEGEESHEGSWSATFSGSDLDARLMIAAVADDGRRSTLTLAVADTD